MAEAEFAISNVLADLRMDPWPNEAAMRSQRCTGVAISVAVALLETNVPNTGARVMLFTGGPCTVGPGQMVARELSEPMRTRPLPSVASVYALLGMRAQRVITRRPTRMRGAFAWHVRARCLGGAYKFCLRCTDRLTS